MTDIPARLTELHSALVEKFGAQPVIAPAMWIHQSGSHRISIYPPRGFDVIHVAKGQTADEALADAFAFVTKMPTADARAKHEWHKDLGKVIDNGHALALPDEVMTPLRASSQAMAKNLLPAPEAAE